MPPFRYGFGAGLALLAAGPVFALLLILGMSASSTGTDNTTNWFVLSLMMLPFALIFGLILGILPIVFGGLLMGWLGARAVWTRHPMIWATIGGVIGLLMALPFNWHDAQLSIMFALTGAVCALIVRYGTRWSDDSV